MLLNINKPLGNNELERIVKDLEWLADTLGDNKPVTDLEPQQGLTLEQIMTNDLLKLVITSLQNDLRECLRVCLHPNPANDDTISDIISHHKEKLKRFYNRFLVFDKLASARKFTYDDPDKIEKLKSVVSECLGLSIAESEIVWKEPNFAKKPTI